MRIRDKLVQYQDNINLKRAKVMIKQIKETRVKIDGLHQLTKELKPLIIDDGNDYTWDIMPKDSKDSNTSLTSLLTANSGEINKTVDSLLLAKAWLGKLLGELGSANPYSGGKKEVKDIEPAADTVDMGEAIARKYHLASYADFIEKSHIEKIDWLRSEIQKVIDEIYAMLEINSRTRLTGENAWKYLCEAKMHLGFEFSRVREENEGGKK